LIPKKLRPIGYIYSRDLTDTEEVGEGESEVRTCLNVARNASFV
jgi:hypothetical protein